MQCFPTKKIMEIWREIKMYKYTISMKNVNKTKLYIELIYF